MILQQVHPSFLDIAAKFGHLAFNQNARSKLPSHISTLMKNPIRWGGGGLSLLRR